MPLIILTDNSKHTVDAKYTELFPVFQNETAIDLAEKSFLKICDFINYYITLDATTRKAIELPDKLIDNHTDVYSWLDKYTELPANELLELINNTAILKIKPLHEFACYRLSKILNSLDVVKIKDIFTKK